MHDGPGEQLHGRNGGLYARQWCFHPYGRPLGRRSLWFLGWLELLHLRGTPHTVRDLGTQSGIDVLARRHSRRGSSSCLHRYLFVRSQSHSVILKSPSLLLSFLLFFWKRPANLSSDH